MRQTEKPATFHVSLLLLVLLISLSGCGSGNSEPETASGTSFPATGTAKFAVFSDTHLYDSAELGGVEKGVVTSKELMAYIAGEGKMLVESNEILTSVIDGLKTKKLDFVLIPGDLTKDGELANHQLMASKLAELKASGTKVYVIPGNHDINNPLAMSYRISPPLPAARTAPAQFRQIYADYGYGEAIARDPDSLSYIAEPLPGLLLFAIDSCRYDDNQESTEPVIAGALKPTTLAWVLERLHTAKLQGKTIIGMMHHGILEHFNGQAALFPEYVLQDFSNVSKTLSDNGLNVIFTGHFHANDITSKSFGSSTLHDIETGSTVMSPSPFRVINFDMANRRLEITTAAVENIASHPGDFKEFSRKFLNDSLTAIAPTVLANSYLSPAQVSSLTPVLHLIVNGFMAHYSGDEAADAITRGAYSDMLGSLSLLTNFTGQYLAALWNDLPPGDNNVTITLD